MITGVPLFRGRDNQDQLLHIMRIVGTPDDRTLRKIATESVRAFGSKFRRIMLISILARDPTKAFPTIPKDPLFASDSQSLSTRYETLSFYFYLVLIPF
jgi:hypothetical protein